MLASYILIPQLGTEGSLHLAALGNAVIALGQTGERFCTVEQPPIAQTTTVNQNKPDNIFVLSTTLFLGLSLLTGFASFIYEVSWIRLLSLLLGASTHSFDIMVSAFVLGLACGGLAAKKLLQKTKHVVILLAIALTSIYFYEFAFSTMEHSKEYLDKTGEGYLLFSLLKYGLNLFLMFPTTFIAGMTLPIITFYLMNVTRNEKTVGAVYGFNTIGAILGAIVAGLVLIPLLQLKMTIATGAFIDIGIGLLLLSLYLKSHRQTAGVTANIWGTPAPLATAAVVALLVITPLLFISFDPNVIAAGYFSNRNYIASIDTFKLLTQNSQPNSDYIPLIDSGAERAFYLREKVDLFNPLANSIVSYQEVTEPEYFQKMLQERYAYYGNYRPDQRLLGQLTAQLTNATSRSNWAQYEGMLYQTMPAPILRDLWNKLEVIKQFRQHIAEGTPPEKARLFFQFLDNVAQNRFADNGPIISDILKKLNGQKLGPVIIRALAINAAMLKSKPLYDQVLSTFVNNNADITNIDKAYMRALQSQWF